MHLAIRAGLLLVLSMAVFQFVNANQPQSPTGAWTRFAEMNASRSGACAATLADGRILITGGEDGSRTLDHTETLGSGGFMRSASMATARKGHTCTTLPDGRVLVVGGRSENEPVKTAEIYDPALEAWKPAGELQVARSGHTATLLSSGRILIAGGETDSPLESLELYDVNARSFRPAGVLSSARKENAASLLPDGSVLIAGGWNGSAALDTTDIYDPNSNTVSAGARLAVGRAGASATALLDGRVLIAGGSNGSEDLVSAEIYDPASETMSVAPSMMTPRRNHIAVRLPNNNNVLFVGGDSGRNSAELFTSWRNAFKAAPSLDESRAEASAAAIGPDGTLVVAGGRGRNQALRSSRILKYATLHTDRDNYEAGSRAVISGSNWAPGESVALTIDESPQTHEPRTIGVTADADGNFRYEYTLDPDTGREYSLTATGRSSDVKVKFAANPSGNLDQCANGPTSATSVCSWINGNVNGSKAHYSEGDSVGYRLVMTNLPLGANYVIIEWDTTQSGRHALDYLTSWDKSVSGHPCIGIADCTDPPATTPIPADDHLLGAGPLGANVPQFPGSFSVWGGTITSFSSAPVYTLAGSYGSSSSTSIRINLNAAKSTVVLAWGGHIATRVDWGIGSSAVAISGSPFHTRLISLNGGGGNQDRSLSSDAVTFPASIKITKNVTGAASTTQAFTISSSGSSSNTLLPPTATLCGSTEPCSKTFSTAPGDSSNFTTYKLTETPIPAGWSFDSVTCSVSGGLTSPTTIGPTTTQPVTFGVKEGDNWDCVYANHIQTNTVTLKKVTVPTSDTGQFDLSITGCATTPNPATGTRGHGGEISCNVVFGADVTVQESGSNLTNYTSLLDCGSQAVTSNTGTSGTFKMPAAAVTCTLTNTRKSNSVTLTKTVLPTGDQGTFDLTVGTKTMTVGNTGSVSENIVGGTNVTVSEVVKSNYTASNISCAGAGGFTASGPTPLTFKMPDVPVGCSITNTRKSNSVTLTKTVLPTGDQGKFKLTVGTQMATVGNGQSVSDTFVGGASVTVKEEANANYTAGNISCTGTNFSTSDTSPLTFDMPDTAVNCTITNTRNPHNVILRKVVDPSTDQNTFAVKISDGNLPDTPGTIAHNGSIERSVTAGFSVVVSETPDNRYVTEIECSGGVTIAKTTDVSTSFTMPDADVTCTLTNHRLATLTIHKVCAPTNDTTASFTPSITGGPTNPGAIPAIKCGAATSPILLKPGTYTVDEVLPPGGGWTKGGAVAAAFPGWAAPGTFAGNCDAVGSVPLSYGQNANCYILNVSNVCTPAFNNTLYPPTRSPEQPAAVPARRAIGRQAPSRSGRR